jgi:hypothetical protein
MRVYSSGLWASSSRYTGAGSSILLPTGRNGICARVVSISNSASVMVRERSHPEQPPQFSQELIKTPPFSE